MYSKSFFEWVIQSSAMAFIVICLILLLRLLLRDKLGPKWNYYLWFLVLIRLLLPFSFQSPVSIFNIMAAVEQKVGFENNKIFYDVYNIEEKSEGFPRHQTAIKDEILINKDIKQGQTIALEDPQNKASASQDRTENQENSNLFTIAFFVWLVGVLILGLYTLTANLRFSISIRRESKLIDGRVMEILEEIKRKMKINTYLSVNKSVKIKTPALFGFIRPKLLLPEALIHKMSDEELKYIIIHELVHLKRKDIIVGWISVAVQVLHWFNPMVWYAFYKMRLDRELSCDALALSYIKDEEQLGYGKTIIKILESFLKPVQLPSIAGILENRSQVKSRLMAISAYKKISLKQSAISLAFIFILGYFTLTNAQTVVSDINHLNVLPVEIKINDDWQTGKSETLKVNLSDEAKTGSPDIKADSEVALIKKGDNGAGNVEDNKDELSGGGRPESQADQEGIIPEKKNNISAHEEIIDGGAENEVPMGGGEEYIHPDQKGETVVIKATISGTLSLPSGVVAPPGGTKIPITAIHDPGTLNVKTDDLYIDSWVFIPGGAASAPFTIGVPSDAPTSYILLYSLQQKVDGCRRNAFYNIDSPVLTRPEATVIDVSHGNVSGINFELQRARTISGKVSLPKGENAPAGGEQIIIYAYTSTFSGLNPIISENVTIPEGYNGVNYTIDVPIIDDKFSYSLVCRSFYENGKELKYGLGFYNSDKTTQDESLATKINLSKSNAYNIDMTLVEN